jgi:1-aminocyclopropane-1-carboxylate deaminase/D-cysteine desulfhydrase-like pyridoxal-dependent ACC family enzyme
VIGVSADESSERLAHTIRDILDGLAPLIDVTLDCARQAIIEVDDAFVGEGYGVPTPESTKALELTARAEGLFVDHTYTAKAMAGLIDRVRRREFSSDQTVLFWHTGGQVGLFQ